MAGNGAGKITTKELSLEDKIDALLEGQAEQNTQILELTNTVQELSERIANMTFDQSDGFRVFPMSDEEDDFN